MKMIVGLRTDLAMFCFELIIAPTTQSINKKLRFIFVQKVLEGELGIVEDYPIYLLSDYKDYINRENIDRDLNDCFGIFG